MNLKPRGDRILVELLELRDQKHDSGLYIPDTADKDKPMFGRVVAIGDGRYTDNGMLTMVRTLVGAVVMFGRYGGMKISLSGAVHIILREEEILCEVRDWPPAQAPGEVDEGDEPALE